MSELLTLSLNVSPAALQRKLLWNASICNLILWSVPRAHDHSWGFNNVDWLVNQELCLPAQLHIHHNSPVQCLHYVWGRTKLSVHLTLHFPITHQQDPKIFKLCCLGKQFITNPEGAIHRFLTENHSLKLEGTDSNSCHCTRGCKLSQFNKKITNNFSEFCIYLFTPFWHTT